MSARATRTLAGFVVLLALVFAVAWVVGEAAGPQPPAAHGGSSVEDHR